MDDTYAWLSIWQQIQNNLPDKAIFLYKKELQESSILFLLNFARAQGITFQLIEINNETNYQQTLESLFLGQCLIYWLKISPELNAHYKRSLHDYLNIYRGPHVIIYCTDAIEVTHNTSGTMVTIPDYLSKNAFGRLGQALNVSPFILEYISTAIYQKNRTLSFDKAYFLLEYGPLLSKQTIEPFIQEWLPIILLDVCPLFALSELFFAKNRSFFVQWSRYSNYYNIPFWITFWSDQLWRAALYCKFKTAGLHAQAKNIAAKLPYSFINQDWRHYQYSTLKLAHDALYERDRRHKQGITTHPIDTWLASFFIEEYRH